MDLEISLSGSNPIELLHALSKIEPFNLELPSIITTVTEDGYTKFEGKSDWINKWIPDCHPSGVTAYWGYGYSGEYEKAFLDFNPDDRIGGIVKLKISDYELDPRAVLNMLAPLPWEIAGFPKIHRKWINPDGTKYFGKGFGFRHHGHGWACAFKGEGHNRLVSRRWLEHGPWRILRGDNDTTLIQFHDLKADSNTAFEQAKIGHEMMGPSQTGGFISINYNWKNDVKGIYTPEDRKLEIVVIDREVTQVEMRDYCAGRYYQVLGEDKPLEKIAYIFMKEEQGRPYLHELWLRELECWVFSNRGVRSRIDEGYNPTPNKPDWVRRLEESDGTITNYSNPI